MSFNQAKFERELLKKQIAEAKKSSFYVKITKNMFLNDYHTLSPTLRVVYITLKLYASQNGVCYPSHELLGRTAGLSKSTIIRSLKLLEDKGWIKIEKRYKKNGKSNVYHLLKEDGSWSE